MDEPLATWSTILHRESWTGRTGCQRWKNKNYVKYRKTIIIINKMSKFKRWITLWSMWARLTPPASPRPWHRPPSRKPLRLLQKKENQNFFFQRGTGSLIYTSNKEWSSLLKKFLMNNIICLSASVGKGNNCSTSCVFLLRLREF